MRRHSRKPSLRHAEALAKAARKKVDLESSLVSSGKEPKLDSGSIFFRVRKGAKKKILRNDGVFLI